MKVRLKPDYPGKRAKVILHDGRTVLLNKRFAEFDEEYFEDFQGDSVEIEGVETKKKSKTTKKKSKKKLFSKKEK